MSIPAGAARAQVARLRQQVDDGHDDGGCDGRMAEVYQEWDTHLVTFQYVCKTCRGTMDYAMSRKIADAAGLRPPAPSTEEVS